MNTKGWMFGLLASVWGSVVVGENVVNAPLTAGEIALVRISAHTATGNPAELDPALRAGLEAGLTINRIKAALEQLYAY